MMIHATLSPRPVRLASLLALVVLVLASPSTFAETPAPGVHWGALGYPDQTPLLSAGLTFNRFTEFDGEGRRYNAIRETMGLNFASVSWTERVKHAEGWQGNLTVGAGPTRDQPSRYLQNEFVHDFLFGFPKVPVGRLREETDFMIDGSVTNWSDLWVSPKLVFAGFGVSSGSLYHEAYARLGIRRWSPMEAVQKMARLSSTPVVNALKAVRLSALSRYGRLYSGAAFRDVAPQSYVAQASLSIGQYREDLSPLWEVESGVTIDSGIFLDHKGDALEERFWTLAIRFPLLRRTVTFEMWNDQLNRKDYGPSYGTNLMVDLYRR